MPENYYIRYLPLVLHLVAALLIALPVLVLTTLIGRRKKFAQKMQAYECGITPTGDTRGRFSVKFYLVGMLFILFDVEAVFLYPWAIILKELKMFGFWEMLVYIGVVLVGFFYIVKKGAIDWGETARVSVENV